MAVFFVLLHFFLRLRFSPNAKNAMMFERPEIFSCLCFEINFFVRENRFSHSSTAGHKFCERKLFSSLPEIVQNEPYGVPFRVIFFTVVVKISNLFKTHAEGSKDFFVNTICYLANLCAATVSCLSVAHLR